MMETKYIVFRDLKVDQLARQLSRLAWLVYHQLNYGQKKTTGDQLVRSSDSIGANPAEGYVRFYHIDRGLLTESFQHGAELMLERQIIDQNTFDSTSELHKPLEVKLNNFITVPHKSAKR